MLIVVDPHNGIPVYRQVMDQIRFHIASGLLDQLRQSLAPTVTVIRQLEIDPPRALDVLRQMLDGSEGKSREKKEKSK